MMTVSDKDTRKDSAMTKRLKEIFEVTVKETVSHKNERNSENNILRDSD